MSDQYNFLKNFLFFLFLKNLNSESQKELSIQLFEIFACKEILPLNQLS